MASGTVLFFCLLVFSPFDNTFGRPSGKLRLKRQTAQSSALAALMSFSVKLSDMERQITSYDKTIKRQAAQIDQLSAKVDSKADRSQLEALRALLKSKMTTVRDEISTKELVVQRYRNQLRNIEGDISQVRNEYHQLLADTTEVLDRFDEFGLHCTNQKTGYAPKANGAIMYLERQWVRCNRNEFLQSFVMSLASNYKGDMVRYVYRCCRVNI